MAYSPPRPPPPPPKLETLAPPIQTTTFAAASSASSPSSLTLSPSVLIIFAILAFVFLASVAIHLFLRFLSSRSPAAFRGRLRRRGHDHHRAAAAGGAEASAAKEVSEGEKARLMERLPLFTLASALSALPKSSPDCAVCQEPFRPDDELRLLPACRHAFHSRCVDPWLRSTLLCPLCRSSIALPFVLPPPLPLPLPPPPPPTTAASAAAAAAAAAAPPTIDDEPRSGSFRIEMGTVSRRRTAPEDGVRAGAGTGTLPPSPSPSPSPSPHAIRSYAMESYDYVVEEEVEAVISAIPPRRAGSEAVAAAKEEKPPEGSGRFRVKDRLDRFTASASSSFNSLRHSGRWSSRWSHRYDDGGGGGGGTWREAAWWDLEGSQQAREGDDGGGGLYAFYRWITGV